MDSNAHNHPIDNGYHRGTASFRSRAWPAGGPPGWPAHNQCARAGARQCFDPAAPPMVAEAKPRETSFARTRATVTWDGVGRCPRAGRPNDVFGQDRAETSVNSTEVAQVWPNSATLGTDSTECGQVQPKFGRHRPDATESRQKRAGPVRCGCANAFRAAVGTDGCWAIDGSVERTAVGSLWGGRAVEQSAILGILWTGGRASVSQRDG